MPEETVFDALYTRTKTGAIHYWIIKAIGNDDGTASVHREYGQIGGKAIINNKSVIDAKGKGSLYEKAKFDAKSEWEEKKDKKGYVTDSQTLVSTASQLFKQSQPITLKSVSSLITKKIPIQIKSSLSVSTSSSVSASSSVSIKNRNYEQYKDINIKFLPMLSHKFVERKHNIQYPCYIQPKIDGIRACARQMNLTEIALTSRSDTTFPYFHEIKKALIELGIDAGVIFDGELYSLSIPFRVLNGYCNRRKMDGKTGYGKIPTDHLQTIHYYIFDCYFIEKPKMPFHERYQYLQNLLLNNQNPYLKLVECKISDSENQIYDEHHEYVSNGNEGIMMRNFDGIYSMKDKSVDLQKYKEFTDSEFEIVGGEQITTGKETGCIMWKLKASDSVTFTCRERSSYELRKQDWINYHSDPSKYNGKKYTVRYQDKFENGVPRFPVGIAIRWDL